MKKRLLALLLVVVMLLGMIPMASASEFGLFSIIHPDTATATYEFFVGEGPEPYATQIVKDGDYLTEPAAPSGTGEFLGWYIGNQKVTFGEQKVTKTETFQVVAKFDNVKYVLFMDKEGADGRVVACKAIPVGGSVTTSDMNDLVQVDAEHGVTGWKRGDNGKEVTTVNYGDDITVLYAVISRGHWLTFESNGGSYIQPQFFTAHPTAPAEPTKAGYSFAGWYLDTALETPANFSEITKAAIVYAKWTAKGDVEYTVLHMLENADDTKYSTAYTETLTGAAGAKTKAAAKRDKNVFPKDDSKGFTPQEIEQQTIKGDGSTVVYVYYKRNSYDVKFYNRYGTFEYTNYCINAKYGANISGDWPGGGWYVSTTSWKAQTNIDVMPLGGQNFYGQQTGDYSQTASYYVEVLPGDEIDETKGRVSYKFHHSDTAKNSSTLKVTEEDKYPINGFTYKEGTENGRKYDGAKFYYTRNSYDIIFINNGKEDTTKSFKYEQDISEAGYTPKAPAGYEGFNFGGWYDNEACEGNPFGFKEVAKMPAHNITLYAKWVKPVFTVTFKQGDNTLKELKVEYGGTVTDDQIPTVTVNDGEAFYGWTQGRENGTPFNFDTKIYKDYVLYANVGSANGYTLTYYVDGDKTVVTDSNKYALNVSAEVKGYTYDGKDNLVFLYWEETKDDGTTVTYRPGSTIKMTENKELHAVFGTKTGPVTLTYHSNFDKPEATYTVTDIRNNDTVTVKAYDDEAMKLPARTGYEFKGWNTQADGTGTTYQPNKPVIIDYVGSNDLYAVWLQKDFTLTIHYVYEDNTTAAPDETKTLAVGENYSVTSPTITGYTPSQATVSGIMPGNNVEVTVTYTKRGDLSYTVNYYLNGTTDKVAEPKIGSGKTFGTTVTEKPAEITGYTAVTNASQDLTIGADSSKNVITFYYYQNVTLTAKSESKTYTGSEQTVEGYTCSVGGLTFAGVSASGKGTDVGEYPVDFSEGAAGTVDSTQKYIVTELKPGTLNITKNDTEVTVTITGNSDTKVYNGSEQSVTGYTTDVGEKPITVALKDGKEAKAAGTNAGEYTMGLTADDFTVTSKNYSNIEVKVVDGKLNITPITDEVIVKVFGNTATKDYNGKEQFVEGFTFEDYGKGITVKLKEGHKAEAKGTVADTYPMNLKAEDFTATSDNYTTIKIEVEDGWLKIVNNAIRFDPNDINGKPIAQKKLVVEKGTAPRETFEVVIKTLDGTVMSTGTANLTKSGTVNFTGFKDLVFNATGTYKFTVGETDNNTSGMRYDSSLYTLSIEVTKDREGNLALGTVSYTKDGSSKSKFPITFTNTYRYSSTPTIKIDSPNKLNTDDHFAYIIGYPDGTVQPNGEITRAEVATIFFRLLKDDVRDKYFTKTNDFSDVNRNDWFNNPVSTMAELGIVKGYPDGTFRPNAPITRAEFAAIAARFDESSRYGETRFTDVAGHWAIREIAKAYNNSWIKGYPDNTFRPNRNITRAEAMTLINRVLNRAPETEKDLLSSMNKWSDNLDVDAWYYLAVQEATNSHDYRRKTNNYEHWLRMLEDPNWAKYER